MPSNVPRKRESKIMKTFIHSFTLYIYLLIIKMLLIMKRFISIRNTIKWKLQLDLVIFYFLYGFTYMFLD